jgi:hypothetical protein
MSPDQLEAFMKEWDDWSNWSGIRAGVQEMEYRSAAAERDRLADRLWVELMDWCKARKAHPTDYNDLFEIVGRIRGRWQA